MPYEAHPLADLFPIIEGEELKQLISDIKSNGLIDPIVLYDGKILDGRNRYHACNVAGIEPRFDTYNGTNPIAFVVSKNMRRRHLTKMQAAALANTIANMGVGRNWNSNSAPVPNNKISQEEAAKMTGTSSRSMRLLNEIKRSDKKLHDDVVAGKTSVKLAKTIIRQREIEASAINKPKVVQTQPNQKVEAQKMINPELIDNNISDADMNMTTEIAERYIAQAALGATLPSSGSQVRSDIDFHRDIRVKYAKTDEQRKYEEERENWNGATPEAVIHYIRGFLAAKKYTLNDLTNIVTEEMYNKFRRENNEKIKFAEQYHPSWALPKIPLMQSDYNKLLQCLHPDRVARFNDDELTEMFREGLEIVRKLKLTISKPDDLRSIPKTNKLSDTFEEFLAQQAKEKEDRYRKAAETRKANKAAKSEQRAST